MDEKIELKSSNRFHYGADNGNRTRILSLGSLHSTTKLCLQNIFNYFFVTTILYHKTLIL